MRSIPYVAAAWCLGYAVLALTWALGAPGFPFGADDPRGSEMGSWLAGATPGWAGALLAASCAAGAAAAFTVGRRTATSTPTGEAGGSAAFAVARGTAGAAGGTAGAAGGTVTRASVVGRWVLAAVLIPLAVVLVLVVPDVRVLQNLAYSFSLHFDLVDWPVVNQVLCLVGGLLIAWTAVLLLRRPPCAECHRPEAVPGERARWTRVGRWAVVVAICAQLPYAVQRAAWNLHVPMGVSRDFVEGLHADLAEKGIHPLMIWMLVVPDVIGALLTLGLVMMWGERFPARVPFLGGRRVPISLAVVPATIVSVAVTVGGLAVYRFVFEDGEVEGTAVPGLLWVPWGLALATATFAYVMRRRHACTGHPATGSAAGHPTTGPAAGAAARPTR